MRRSAAPLGAWLLFAAIFGGAGGAPPAARAGEFLPTGELGIQNGRFGSRLNLDVHFDPSRNEFWTGTRGSMMDGPATFTVATRLSDASVQRFSPSDQYYLPYRYQVLKLAPDRTMQLGAHTRRLAIPGNPNDALLIARLSTVSPFAPTRALDDPDLPMSVMPAFYEEITLLNPRSRAVTGSLLVALDGAVDYRQQGAVKTVLYRSPDGKDGEGIRALSVVDDGGSISWGIGDYSLPRFHLTGRLANGNGSREPRGSVGGFAIPFTIAPGQSWKKVLVYAGYDGGDVVFDQRVGQGLKFYYTTLFRDVDDVVGYAFAHAESILARSEEFSLSLQTGDPARDFVASEAVHSYLASTFLLYDPATGKPRYYVMEGDCGYLSTIDVAHETGAFEAAYIPWALKLELEEWADYAVSDGYGLYLQHDMGQYATVMPSQGYLGNMAAEENANYVLLTFLYWKRTDDTGFVEARLPFLQQLLDSLANRDTNGNGIVDTASYGTTFDFDAGVSALGHAAENTYMGVKELSAFVAAAEMYRAVGNRSKADVCERYARGIGNTLAAARRRLGYLPVSLAPGVAGGSDRSVVLFDGLTHLLATDTASPVVDDLIANVGPDLHEALAACDAAHGYRLTSSSAFTWGSKTFNTKLIVDRFAARGLGAFPDQVVGRARATIQTSDLGYVDSWNVDDGTLAGLRLYPRGVSILGDLEARSGRQRSGETRFPAGLGTAEALFD